MRLHRCVFCNTEGLLPEKHTGHTSSLTVVYTCTLCQRTFCTRCIDPVVSAQMDQHPGWYPVNLCYGCAEDTTGRPRRLYRVRLYDTYERRWIDISGPSQWADTVDTYQRLTGKGTRNTRYEDGDYYKIFPADTRMVNPFAGD